MYRHFTALINYKMNLMGLNNSQGAQLCGMCQKTFEKKKTSPEKFRLDEVSAMGDLQMFPWQTKINFIAEAAGFEPASRFCPANCFRGSLLQPLGHASFVSNQGKNTSIGINSKIYERKMRKIVRLSTASWRLPHKSMP